LTLMQNNWSNGYKSNKTDAIFNLGLTYLDFLIRKRNLLIQYKCYIEGSYAPLVQQQPLSSSVKSPLQSDLIHSLMELWKMSIRLSTLVFGGQKLLWNLRLGIAIAVMREEYSLISLLLHILKACKVNPDPNINSLFNKYFSDFSFQYALSLKYFTSLKHIPELSQRKIIGLPSGLDTQLKLYALETVSDISSLFQPECEFFGIRIPCSVKKKLALKKVVSEENKEFTSKEEKPNIHDLSIRQFQTSTMKHHRNKTSNHNLTNTNEFAEPLKAEGNANSKVEVIQNNEDKVQVLSKRTVEKILSDGVIENKLEVTDKPLLQERVNTNNGSSNSDLNELKDVGNKLVENTMQYKTFDSKVASVHFGRVKLKPYAKPPALQEATEEEKVVDEKVKGQVNTGEVGEHKKDLEITEVKPVRFGTPIKEHYKAIKPIQELIQPPIAIHQEIKQIKSPLEKLITDEIGKLQSTFVINMNEVKNMGHIGTGASAEVYKAIYRGTEVAVKHLKHFNKDDAGKIKEFRRELEALLLLRHPNLVLFIGAGVTSNGNTCLVTEYCSGGTVFHLLHESLSVPLTWRQRTKIALDIAKGMNALHSYIPPVLHRDLKSLNLLLAEPVNDQYDSVTVKISDFGLARFQSTDQYMTGATGTFHWMAPEVLMNAPYTIKADVYSYGIVLWEIITRKRPYEGMNGAMIGYNVIHLQMRPNQKYIPSDCPPLVSLALNLNSLRHL